MRKGIKYSRSFMILSSLGYTAIAHSRLLTVWTDFLSLFHLWFYMCQAGVEHSMFNRFVVFFFLPSVGQWTPPTSVNWGHGSKKVVGMCYVTGETLRPQIPEACTVQCNLSSCPRGKKLIYPLCLRKDKASTQCAKTALFFSTDLGKECVQKNLKQMS